MCFARTYEGLKLAVEVGVLLGDRKRFARTYEGLKQAHDGMLDQELELVLPVPMRD